MQKKTISFASPYQREVRLVNEVEMTCLKDDELHQDIPIPEGEDDYEFLWGIRRAEMLRISKEVRTCEEASRECGKKHTLRGSCSLPSPPHYVTVGRLEVGRPKRGSF
jgi:hypothetical protein